MVYARARPESLTALGYQGATLPKSNAKIQRGPGQGRGLSTEALAVHAYISPACLGG